MKPARYVLRFDDICPTMNWATWRVVEEHLVRTNVRPLLAVVPDNRDPLLQVGPPDPDFWSRVRGWQQRGWTVAIHGFQHLYTTPSGGLLGLNARSEFAGLPEDEQARRLHEGLAIFEREGVEPEAWVAPGHSFDATTLRLLGETGVRVVSDGFTLLPFTDALGLTWIPQQLWSLKPRPFGVWTVCHHINEFGRGDLEELTLKMERRRTSIANVPDLVREFSGRRATWLDHTVSWLLKNLYLLRHAERGPGMAPTGVTAASASPRSRA